MTHLPLPRRKVRRIRYLMPVLVVLMLAFTAATSYGQAIVGPPFIENWEDQQPGDVLPQLLCWTLSPNFTVPTPGAQIFPENGSNALALFGGVGGTMGVQTVFKTGGPLLTSGQYWFSQDVRVEESEPGVPILSKIPYVSRLFKNVGIGRETESLMMMVTPRIIIQDGKSERGRDGGIMEAEISLGFEKDGVFDVAAEGIVPINPLETHTYGIVFDALGTSMELFIDDQPVLAGNTAVPFDLTGPVGVQLEVTDGNAAIDNIILQQIPTEIPEPSALLLTLIAGIGLTPLVRRQSS